MSDRQWLPTLGELIDRLSIHQLKEVFIPENKKNYAKEMNDMVHDIDMILKEHKGEITGEVIRAIVVLSQMNLHIWQMNHKSDKVIRVQIILC